jgi:hypothetical protein
MMMEFLEMCAAGVCVPPHLATAHQPAEAALLERAGAASQASLPLAGGAAAGTRSTAPAPRRRLSLGGCHGVVRAVLSLAAPFPAELEQAGRSHDAHDELAAQEPICLSVLAVCPAAR